MKLYKREGRRFVAINLEDNAGKYYQKDGSFTDLKDDNSIGFCIISSIKEDVIISLTDIGTEGRTFTFSEAKKALLYTSSVFTEIPKIHEIMIPLTKYKSQCNIKNYHEYWCEDMASAACAARAGYYGIADTYAASGAWYVAGLRPVLRLKH